MGARSHGPPAPFCPKTTELYEGRSARASGGSTAPSPRVREPERRFRTIQTFVEMPWRGGREAAWADGSRRGVELRGEPLGETEREDRNRHVAGTRQQGALPAAAGMGCGAPAGIAGGGGEGAGVVPHAGGGAGAGVHQGGALVGQALGVGEGVVTGKGKQAVVVGEDPGARGAAPLPGAVRGRAGGGAAGVRGEGAAAALGPAEHAERRAGGGRAGLRAAQAGAGAGRRAAV